MLHIAPPLLKWFYENRRTLPFREDPTPYHIWVSEIMLQQTRMSAVLPYYARFMEELPTPAHLAACSTDRLHKLWEGLGYYSRADNLRRAAIMIMEKHGGHLPSTYEELLALPGIGEYTAGAIASISYQIPVPAVDGNVMRVFSRLYNDRADILISETKKRYTARVVEELPEDTPGDFNQALMELGALICVPGEPHCGDCPLADRCAAYAAGSAAYLPIRGEKKPRRIRKITILLVRCGDKWLLARRPEGGLLSGLWQPFLFEEDVTEDEAISRLRDFLPGIHVEASAPLPPSRHLFSHIEWQMSGWSLSLAGDLPALPEGYAWAGEEDMENHAIPGAFKAYKPLLYGKDS
ncbi:MAG: A/G-specific adenine glycosylase [Clostridia bacterium]|nr:A/G-specific adenine glycosylase [Clostridia bacterium]